jgi:hypothetical protein
MISVAYAHGQEVDLGPVSVPIDFLLIGAIAAVVLVIEYRRRRK